MHANNLNLNGLNIRLPKLWTSSRNSLSYPKCGIL